MYNKHFDSTTFSYKMFLLILIIAQIHLLFCHQKELHLLGIIFSGILLVYLLFRLYLLNKLGNKAKYLSLTLTEFLEKREDYDTKCKEQQGVEDNVKN